MPKLFLLHPRNLGDGKSFKHYPKGQHEVHADVLEHWFTKAQIKLGHISVMADEPKEEPKEELKEEPKKSKK